MISGVSPSTILIAAGATTWLFLALGLILYGGARIPRLAGQGLDVIAVVVAAIALVATVVIPEKLDHDNNARQANATCFSSITAARKALNTVVQGYTVAPEARDQRRADWETLRIELENTSFGCHDARLSVATSSELRALIGDFAAAKTASDRPDPDAGYLDRVTTWTTRSLQELQSAR
jgi:FPC/CPF motif-containing protein YcgG